MILYQTFPRRTVQMANTAEARQVSPHFPMRSRRRKGALLKGLLQSRPCLQGNAAHIDAEHGRDCVPVSAMSPSTSEGVGEGDRGEGGLMRPAKGF